MRNLVLLVGIPGSGKSTWIRKNDLEAYTLSYDTMRLQNHGETFDYKGRSIIKGTITSSMKKSFEDTLLNRFSCGDMVIIDNTNLSMSELNYFEKLVKPYGYTISYKIFDTDLKTCLTRISLRTTNYIPEIAMRKMNVNFDNIKIPKDFIEIKEINDLNSNIKSYDYRGKTFYVIGDLHGCYNEFKKFLDLEYNPKDMYFFVGDYVDRGYDNKSIILKLIELQRLNSNIIILEGNHEKWLRYWANGRVDLIKSKEFLDYTMPDLESKPKLKLKSGREFLRNSKLVCNLITDGGTMLITHGGINGMFNTNSSTYKYRSADSYIKGEGGYGNLLSFFKGGSESHDIIVHGHRNVNDVFKTKSTDGKTTYYDLEGGIERGKALKYIKVSPLAIETKFIKSLYNYDLDMTRLIEELKASPLINLSDCINPDVKAFNFTREAFYSKKWTKLVCKARGLFIDTERKKVVGRGYSKFFNYKENDQVSDESIKGYSYPLKVSVKHNGYLGILYSTGTTRDKLVFNSKAGDKTDYANHFSTLVNNTFTDTLLDYLAGWLFSMNKSLAVEVVDVNFDPHLSEYEDNRTLSFLDVIDNSAVFSKEPLSSYPLLVTALEKKKYHKPPNSNFCTVNVNNIYKQLSSYKSFLDFLKLNESITGEGFVFEDQDGKMFKWKSPKYLIKKDLRTYLDIKDKTSLYRNLTNRGLLGGILSAGVLKTLLTYAEGKLKNNEVTLDIHLVDSILNF